MKSCIVYKFLPSPTIESDSGSVPFGLVPRATRARISRALYQIKKNKIIFFFFFLLHGQAREVVRAARA